MPNVNPRVPTISDDQPRSLQAVPEGLTQAEMIAEEMAGEAYQEEQELKDQDWITLARTAYEESTDYLQAGIFDRFQRSYALARSKHPAGSKYHTASYAYRSKLFRGKTAAAIRKNEAAAAVALFSTRDAVHIAPENDSDPAQVEAAKAIHDVANYHLGTGPDWFMNCIGAYNEAQTVGVVASKQYWDFEEVNGKVLKDRPKVELIPIENLRLHPSCDWVDPINSSPYVVIATPMFIGDIYERMDAGDWKNYTGSQLQGTTTDQDNNVVRQARTGNKQEDPKDQDSFEDEFSMVWVHENFVRVRGQEYVYFTAGTTLLLSDPIPLDEAYPHCVDGKRPIAFGRTAIEPHNIFVTSLPERVEGAQLAANDIANQRKDNVELAMNKRTFALRKGGVDFHNLMRNAPGSVVLMDHLEAVKQEDVRDVTASAYQEQNMINADFDEIAGTFSNASVSTNRALNETVGGMNMLQGNSNVLTEYQLRIFVETWVEHIARDLVQMIKFYEDDDVIARITGKAITNEMLQQTIVTARVSAGFGATDPQQKIQKLMFGLETLLKIKPEYMRELEGSELAKEIFGALGYNDGKRFLPRMGEEGQEDPKVAELMQMVQQLQKIIDDDTVKQQGRIQVEQVKAGSRREELLIRLQQERQLKLTGMALDRKTTVDKITKDAGIADSKNQLALLTELNRQRDIAERKRELDFKINSGKQGI